MTPTPRIATALVLFAMTTLTAPASRAAEPASFAGDVLTLGDPTSERDHGLTATASDVVAGGLRQPARRLLPQQPAHWEGGRLAFRLKVDPDRPNYFTVRLWGSDVSPNMLILHCEGKQIGYRHLGDIDVLDFGSKEPGFPGRFFYRTTPLPTDLTRGKTEVSFEVRSTGSVYGYGQTFEQYQKPMTEPTRGLYAVYTHADGHFVPPAGERQGDAPADLPARAAPGAEVLDELKARVNKEVDDVLSDRRPPGQLQMQLLGRAYNVTWTSAHNNPAAVAKIAQGADALYAMFRADPKTAENGPGVYNPDWLGLGPAGDAVRLVAGAVQPLLDQPAEGGGGATRRAAWADMFAASRDWHRRHRRQYTNQSMINDLYGIYLSNRGVQVVDPAKAMPENEARRYLYESVGIEPWRDSDRGAGVNAETGARSWSVGPDYFQLTAKGLTKELGYVGNYGEVLDWMTHIYNATRPTPAEPGDERLRAQLVKAEHARAAFRYPLADGQGNRAMRMENVIGWRDMLYPGEVTYAERSAWEGSAVYSVAATLDPRSVGAVQQMFDDNQFFQSVAGLIKDKGTRVTNTLVFIPDDYERIKSQPPSAHRLPMTPGQPDFVFADEDVGALALKRGDEVLYVSLYWRARYGINGLARVHHVSPTVDRIAVVRQETQFEPSGQFYTRANWTNFGFGNGGMRYPGEQLSAHAGERLPIAKVPEGIRFKPGDENVHAGKGEFYALRYGPYLIGMNTTAGKTFELQPPAGAVGEATDLVSKHTVPLTAPVKVGPKSTVVLYLGS